MNSRKSEVKEARKRASQIRRRAMADPVANPSCKVCGFAYPPSMHLHHIHPLAESEIVTDDHVWLCPNCHAMVHEIRRMYYSKRKPSSYRLRLAHLDYWLGEVCPPDAAKKLCDIAKKSEVQ